MLSFVNDKRRFECEKVLFKAKKMSHDASNSPSIDDSVDRQISPVDKVFHQLNNNEQLMYHQTPSPPDYVQQTPSQNAKKSFCIEALLAKKDRENSSESDMENKRFNHLVNNNNYKENIISREFDRSPSDDQMSRCVELCDEIA